MHRFCATSKLAWAVPAIALFFGCGDDGGGNENTNNNGAGASETAEESSASEDPSMSSDPTLSSDPSMTSGGPSECLDKMNSDLYDTTDGATESLMQTWGAPCESDADCIELLGDPDAVCDDMFVIYQLPGRYCSKPCELPDTTVTFVLDDPTCDPDGGIACVGQRPLLQRCAPACTDDLQCDREGYVCRTMPQISQPTDPAFCLMPDCCQGMGSCET
jgi:hypothetical protein